VYFSTYEIVKQHLGGNMGPGHHPIATGTIFKAYILILATAGACAAVTSDAFMNPFDGNISLVFS